MEKFIIDLTIESKPGIEYPDIILHLNQLIVAADRQEILSVQTKPPPSGALKSVTGAFFDFMVRVADSKLGEEVIATMVVELLKEAIKYLIKHGIRHIRIGGTEYKTESKDIEKEIKKIIKTRIKKHTKKK